MTLQAINNHSLRLTAMTCMSTFETGVRKKFIHAIHFLWSAFYCPWLTLAKKDGGLLLTLIFCYHYTEPHHFVFQLHGDHA